MSCDVVTGGWSFKIMIDRKAFISIPYCLNVEDQKIPVILTGHRLTFWTCRETSHLSSSCQEKKASGVLASADTKPPLAESVISVCPIMGMPAIRTAAVKPPV